MMADTPTVKLHPVTKWSLIIGPVLVVIFNFLLPTNGVSPVDPEDTATFIGKLGADADIAQIYMVIILLGIILYTRAIIGLFMVTPTGSRSRARMSIGMLGGVAALSLWGVTIGLGLAEASGAEAAVAGSEAGTAVATSMHAAFFGVYQAATFVAYISLIPLGGGIAVSGIVRKEFGWIIIIIGAATVIMTAIMPVKTEAGIMIFGIMAVIWGVVFLAMGLQTMRQDMNSSSG